MKKCPFCKAEIEDNARFCLYCMRTLNEKEVISPPQKKIWPWLLVAGGTLLLAVLALMLLLPKWQDTPQGETKAFLSNHQTAKDTNSEQVPAEDTYAQPSTDAADQTPGQSPNDTPPAPMPNNTAQETPEGTKPAVTPTSPSQPQTPTQSTTPPTDPEDPTEETIDESADPESPAAKVVYSYRAARSGDEYSAQYVNTGNDIVITGITQRSQDGIYNIPAYIDGKKVIANMANAFSNSNAKVVYIPSTLRVIWNHAFHGCALTDIYFTHNIYIEANAFRGVPGELTIHCPANCQDRNLRYYKNSAANYGATWKEWNGL